LREGQERRIHSSNQDSTDSDPTLHAMFNLHNAIILIIPTSPQYLPFSLSRNLGPNKASHSQPYYLPAPLIVPFPRFVSLATVVSSRYSRCNPRHLASSRAGSRLPAQCVRQRLGPNFPLASPSLFYLVRDIISDILAASCRTGALASLASLASLGCQAPGPFLLQVYPPWPPGRVAYE
jgi:hypothetical protein